jgi:hypothetical protein
MEYDGKEEFRKRLENDAVKGNLEKLEYKLNQVINIEQR